MSTCVVNYAFADPTTEPSSTPSVTSNPNGGTGSEGGSTPNENVNNENQSEKLLFTVETNKSEKLDSEKWYTGIDFIVKVKSENESNKLKSYKVINKTDGAEIKTGELSGAEDKITISNKGIALNSESKADLKILVTDEKGNEQEFEFKIKTDTEAPVISGLNPTGEFSLHDGKLYGGKDGVNFTANVTDAGSGIEGVNLVKVDHGGTPSNPTSGGTVSKVSVENGKISFNIKQNGSYELQTQDNAGNTRVVKFSEFNIPEEMVFSDAKPTAHITVNGAEYNGEWLTKSPVTIQGVFSDNLGLKIQQLIVNDKKVEERLTTKGSTLEVNLNDVATPKDGIYRVKARVFNLFGNHKDVEQVVKADFSVPEITGNVDMSGINIEDGKVYSNKPIKVSLKATDQGSGVKKIRILERETGTELLTKNSGDYTFTFSTTGALDVEVTDNAGNVVKKGLEEILGKPEFGQMVQDTDKPELKVTKPEGGKYIDNSGKTWFNKIPEGFKFDTKDANLKQVTVDANGKEIFKGTENGYKDKVVDLSGVQPNKDGSVNLKVVSVDKAGNIAEQTLSYYIDTEAPKVTDLTFITPEGGEPEGNVKKAEKSGDWSYFYKNSIAVRVNVTDEGASGEVKKVVFTAIESNGKQVEKEVKVNGGVAQFDLGSNYRGIVKAYAEDNVGNKSEIIQSDGVITETADVHVNSSKVDVKLSNPVGKDINGLDLYNGMVGATINLGDRNNGIGKITWGSNAQVSGTGEQTVDTRGDSSGSFKVDSKDKNIVTEMSGTLGVDGDQNGITLDVALEDNAGNVSKAGYTFSIDKTAPVVKVSYDQNNPSGFYNSNRTATITVTDRNFTTGGVNITGTPGQIGTWRTNENGDWVTTMTFSEDLDYQWGIQVTDLAGNKSEIVTSEKFTIDKTAPNLSVSFNNNNVRNGKYYKEDRVATITVVDKNFDPSGLTVNGTQVTGWNSVGETHQTSAVFNSDGDYSFNLAVTDKAGNRGNDFSSGEFTIDKTRPELKINGVQSGVSYRKGLEGSVTLSDAHLDGVASNVSLAGRETGNQNLKGAIEGNNGSFFIDNPGLDKKNDDVYTLKATAMDLAGNEVTDSAVWAVNRFGSDYKFLNNGILGKYLQGVTEDIKVRETTVTELDLDAGKVSVIKDGNTVNLKPSEMKVDETGGNDSKYKYDYNIRKDLFKEDGRYLVQIYSKTKDGVESSSLSQEYEFIVDSEAPKVTISGVENGKSYNDTKRNVNISITDKSGVDSVYIIVNGNKVEPREENGVYAITLSSSENTQSIEVKATDKAGNETTESVDSIRVKESFLGGVLESPITKAVLGVLAALLTAVGVIFWRKKKEYKEEQKRREELRTALVSSTGSSGGTGIRSTAEELEDSNAETEDYGAEGGYKPTRSSE